MATYTELFELSTTKGFQDRVAFACVKKAQSLLDAATPSTNEVAWAASAIESPASKGIEILRYVLAANSDSTVTQINAVTDAAIQTSVDSAVDALIAGGAI